MADTLAVYVRPTMGLTIKGVRAAALGRAKEFFRDEDETHYTLEINATNSSVTNETEAAVKVTHEIPESTRNFNKALETNN
jgi:hypothetical protein